MGTLTNKLKYSVMTVLADVVQLCKDWPRMDRSIEKFVLASVIVPVLLIGFFNLPWIMFCICLWSVLYRAFTLMWATFCKVLQALPFVPSVGANGHLLASGANELGNGPNGQAVVKRRTIPGRTGLPFIGETVSFVVGSREFLLERRRQYGGIFATSIDFSGTYMVARRVVCLFNTTNNSYHTTNTNSSTNTTNTTNNTNNTITNKSTHHALHRAPHLKYVAYSGLFGSSSPVRAAVPLLAERVLNNYDYLERWEDVATPVIRNFLGRLVYEGSFSFADRVNELACELVSSIFLNMTGLSVPLLAAMDSYLGVSSRDSGFNASLKYRKQISNSMHIAVFEEDRRFYSRPWDTYNNSNNRSNYNNNYNYTSNTRSGTSDENIDETHNNSILSEVLDMCTDALHTASNTNTTNTTTDIFDTVDTPTDTNDQHDLLFILLVEVIYSVLVQQLRTLVLHITTNHSLLPAQCRAHYTQYLSARQLVGNVSGAGLGRLAWGSTIYDIDVECSMEEEVKSNEDLCSGGIGGSISGIAAHTTDTVGRSSSTSTVTANTASTSTITPADTSNTTNTTSSGSNTANPSSIGNFLLSHIPWPLSPAPTPAPTPARITDSTVNTSTDNTSTKADASASGSAGTTGESSRHKHKHRSSGKSDKTSGNGSSGRADYSFPISSSSSGTNSSGDADSELNYSSDTISAGGGSAATRDSSVRRRRAHITSSDSGADTNTTATTTTTTATATYTTAPAAHTLETPPVNQYGRRAHTVHPTTTATAVSTSSGATSGNTSTSKTTTLIPHITTIRPSMYTTTITNTGSAIAIVSSPSPSTPTSRNTNSSSTSSVTRSANKYTGRYGPRRTPGRAHYVVTPGRSSGVGSGSGGGTSSGTSSGTGGSKVGGSSGGVFPMLQNLLGTGDDGTSAMIARHTNSSSGVNSSSGGNRVSKSRNSVRHRQQLIINYITSVKRVVDEARVGTQLAPLPLQYCLSLCTQTHDVILRDPANGTKNVSGAPVVDAAEYSRYTINKDDLVIVVHPHSATNTTTNLNSNSTTLNTNTADTSATANAKDTGASPVHTTATATTTASRLDSPASYYTAASPSTPTSSTSNTHSHHSLHSLYSNNSNNSAALNTPTTTAHTDLGIFSELILSILTHELTTGYQWEVPVGSTGGGSGSSGVNSVSGGTVGISDSGSSSRHNNVRARATNTNNHTIHTTTNTTNTNTNALTSLLTHITPYITPTTTSATTGFCTVADHSVPVKKFRTSPDNFAFLIGTEGSVQYGGDASGVGCGSGGGGGGGGVDDDMRYYSDGL